MTIHYFSITAVFVLWSYILLCICGKLALDRSRSRRIEKRKAAIRAFFAPGQSPAAAEADFRQVQSYARDDELFNYACECYSSQLHCYTPQEKDSLEAFVKRLIYRRILTVKEGDALGRCLIISSIYRCRILSEDIRLFLLSCEEGSQLEQLWAELPRQTVHPVSNKVNLKWTS